MFRNASRRRTALRLVVIVSAGALLAGLSATTASAGGGRTRVVRPGHSIQAAIDAGSPR